MNPFEAMNILYANKAKNFAQRALHPDQSPKLDNGFLQDPSTHSMAWGEGDGKGFAYPTVVQMQPGGWLQRLANMQAWQHAMKTKEFIPFDDKRKAAEFSTDYKTIWPKGGERYVPFYQK
jgi:hypothetical protein